VGLESFVAYSNAIWVNGFYSFRILHVFLFLLLFFRLFLLCLLVSLLKNLYLFNFHHFPSEVTFENVHKAVRNENDKNFDFKRISFFTLLESFGLSCSNLLLAYSNELKSEMEFVVALICC